MLPPQSTRREIPVVWVFGYQQPLDESGDNVWKTTRQTRLANRHARACASTFWTVARGSLRTFSGSLQTEQRCTTLTEKKSIIKSTYLRYSPGILFSLACSAALSPALGGSYRRSLMIDTPTLADRRSKKEYSDCTSSRLVNVQLAVVLGTRTDLISCGRTTTDSRNGTFTSPSLKALV